MKILLIEPPFYRLYDPKFSLNKYPLSLGYLASVLKSRTSHEVLVYNADFSKNDKPILHKFLSGKGFDNYMVNIDNGQYEVWNEVKKVITDFKPDLIGLTSKSQNFKSACVVAKMVKSIDPQIITVVGGPHPTLIDEKILNHQEFDYAVVGEGEISFFELINSIETKSDPGSVPGIIWRNGRSVAVNAKRPLIPDLDVLPNPYLFVKDCLKDYNLYPLSSFRSIFATRGCPFNCTFCGSHAIWSRKVRFRSPANVIEEIKFLQSIGVPNINFDDDTFGVTHKYLTELCEQLIHECNGIKWSCEIHVKLLNDKVLKLMKKAGCDLIKIGIESGNNQILKSINKHITIEEAFSAARMINNAHIHTMSFFMVGFPLETEETMTDTIDAIKKIDGFVTYSIFTPYIGTKAYDQCLEMNLIPENFDVSLYNHQSPNNCFTPFITPDRFRELANNIELFVDAKNVRYEQRIRLNRFRPSNIFNKIYNLIKLFIKRNN